MLGRVRLRQPLVDLSDGCRCRSTRGPDPASRRRPGRRPARQHGDLVAALSIQRVVRGQHDRCALIDQLRAGSASAQRRGPGPGPTSARRGRTALGRSAVRRRCSRAYAGRLKASRPAPQRGRASSSASSTSVTACSVSAVTAAQPQPRCNARCGASGRAQVDDVVLRDVAVPAVAPLAAHLADGRRPQPAYRVEQRGLARSAAADDPHHLALSNGERDSAQDQLSGPDPLAHVAQIDQRSPAGCGIDAHAAYSAAVPATGAN